MERRAADAVNALLMAISMLVMRALSIRWNMRRLPLSSVTATSMSTPTSRAFFSAAAMITRASSSVSFGTVFTDRLLRLHRFEHELLEHLGPIGQLLVTRWKLVRVQHERQDVRLL